MPAPEEPSTAAANARGGWAAAGIPTLTDFVKTGAWFAGPPEELVAYLQSLQDKYPALQYVNVSSSMGTPKAVMLEQLGWFAREVMPAFTARR